MERLVLVAALLGVACGGAGREEVGGDGNLAEDTEAGGQDGTVAGDVSPDSIGLLDGAVETAVDFFPGDLPQEAFDPDLPKSEIQVEVVQDVEPPCGDPEVAKNYSQCVGSDDEESCKAAGGTWTIVGLAPEPECQCPTGQGGCGCKGPGDCMSTCVADFVGGEMFNCEGVTSGHCSPVSITVGCWCYFMGDGSVMGLCAD